MISGVRFKLKTSSSYPNYINVMISPQFSLSFLRSLSNAPAPALYPHLIQVKQINYVRTSQPSKTPIVLNSNQMHIWMKAWMDSFDILFADQISLFMKTSKFKG